MTKRFHPVDLLIPGLMIFTAWCAAGFPLGDGQKWERILIIPLIFYVPFKLLKIAIHKDAGILRHQEWARKAASILIFGLWVTIAVVGLFQIGLLAIPGSLLPGYLLWLIWQNISGDDGGKPA